MTIPPGGPIAPNRQLLTATVAANVPLCREHWRLELSVPNCPPTAPGQFIQILCRAIDVDGHATAGEPMLRRPFSLAGRVDDAGGARLSIIHRVVGAGTGWMSERAVGEAVSLIGPLGNCFQLPKKDQTALLVGGGVGIPPMLYLAERLAGQPAIAMCGALSADLLPLSLTADPEFPIGEFAKHGVRSIVTTDDGSAGEHGRVTVVLQRWLEQNRPAKPIIYTCGPEPMLKAVAEIAERFSVPCQIAVERAMACGLGTCQSCCIRVRKSDPAAVPMPGSDWCYRLACTDGPVFDAASLLW